MADPHIVIALFPGITHLDFTGPHQVFVGIPDAKVTVASLGGQDIAAQGLTFSLLEDLAAIKGCDVLCVPGGSGAIDAMIDAAFIAQIRRLGDSAKYLTSICTGSLILGAAGFLKGKRAATHWALRDFLPIFGATVSESRVERDGNLITGGGVTAGIDFALVMAAELKGRDVAETIQLNLEYAPDPPFLGGRPELARPEILAKLRAGVAAGLGAWNEATAMAARQLTA